MLGLPTLLLDVPLTTASDIALVRALCSRSPDMLVTAPANDAVTLARLRSGLGAEIVDLDSAASQPGLNHRENGSLLRLQRHIFNDVAAAPQARLDDQVVIFSAPGESRECVEIVMMFVPRIRRCARSKCKDGGPVGKTMFPKLPRVSLKQRTEIGRDKRNRIRLYLL
jgi:hypothetical protein